MSTYMYLECLDHDPPILSADEVGQHTYDLENIRAYVANRELYLSQQELENKLGTYIDYGTSWANTAARFLIQHPKCNIGIRDEYGRDYALHDAR
jgi:hypothetical protein